MDHLGVRNDQVHVVHIGADTDLFAPNPAVPEVPGRIVTTSSADVPLKGLVFLVEALAKVRTEHPATHLVVVGKRPQEGPVAQAIERYGLDGAVDFVKGISDAELVDLIRSAQVACVPSCTRASRCPPPRPWPPAPRWSPPPAARSPEVAGRDGETCLAVPPGDADALAAGLNRLLGDAQLRARLGRAGRERVLEKFTWARAAEAPWPSTARPSPATPAPRPAAAPPRPPAAPRRPRPLRAPASRPLRGHPQRRPRDQPERRPATSTK